jgi:ubiquinone/menaquinone biosynthesis C-methylase UbiE
VRTEGLTAFRQLAIGLARGLVLEIGVGSGLNLRFYGSVVDRVCGIDPSPELLRMASKRARRALAPVSLFRGSAEQLPFADAAFDAIVMTWTPRSIPNPIAALTEMRQVLKPGGRLHFRRAWVVSGNPDSPLAASVDAVLETRQRRLSSRSQDR